MTIKLLLVDDHIVVRMGLRMMLEHEPDIEIIGEASTAHEAMDLVSQQVPDVILMDIGLPDESGIDVTRKIKAIHNNIAVVALTIHEDEEYFFKMLEAGASGYIPKRAAPEELLSAIRAAAEDQVFIYPSLAKILVKDFLDSGGSGTKREKLDGLTSREQEVIAHLADGASITEIADTLTISPKTVSRHRENIMRKLNLQSRAELVKYAIRKGIIQL